MNCILFPNYPHVFLGVCSLQLFPFGCHSKCIQRICFSSLHQTPRYFESLNALLFLWKKRSAVPALMAIIWVVRFYQTTAAIWASGRAIAAFPRFIKHDKSDNQNNGTNNDFHYLVPVMSNLHGLYYDMPYNQARPCDFLPHAG